MADLQYVKGLDQLKLVFDQLPPRITRTVLKYAVSSAARVVEVQVAAEAPTASRAIKRGSKGVTPPGTLKRAPIIKYVRQNSGPTQVEYIVAIRQGTGRTATDAFYGRFVEFGHAIVPRKGKGRALAIRGRRAQAKLSGARVLPHAFMAPAFEHAKDAALRVLEQRLREGLARVFR